MITCAVIDIVVYLANMPFVQFAKRIRLSRSSADELKLLFSLRAHANSYPDEFDHYLKPPHGNIVSLT
jgi:hypothetical protein